MRKKNEEKNVQILERGRWIEEKKMLLERALCLRGGAGLEHAEEEN